MRINNAFSANFPIVDGNSDFETVIKSNDLSFVEFYLVDANLHEINLLCPLYLTIHVQPLPDNDYNIYKLMLEQQNPPEGLSQYTARTTTTAKLKDKNKQILIFIHLFKLISF